MREQFNYVDPDAESRRLDRRSILPGERRPLPKTPFLNNWISGELFPQCNKLANKPQVTNDKLLLATTESFVHT